MGEDTVKYCTTQSDSSAEAVGVVLLAVAEALVEVAVTKVVAGLEAADEADTEDEGAAEEEAELATLASTTAALPLAAAEEDEEESKGYNTTRNRMNQSRNKVEQTLYMTRKPVKMTTTAADDPPTRAATLLPLIAPLLAAPP